MKEKEMKEKEQQFKKIKAISKICLEIDILYNYAISLIPKNPTHNLGHKKELLKGTVEKTILNI